MSVLPIWVQWLSALGPIFITAVVGLYGVLIARRQWVTARDKLRLDLFDKRYAVYVDTFGRYLWRSDAEGHHPGAQADLLMRAQLLFGKEAREQMMAMFRTDGELRHQMSLPTQPAETTRGNDASERMASVSRRLMLILAHELELPRRGGRPDPRLLDY